MKDKNGGLIIKEKRLYGKELCFSVYKMAISGTKFHAMVINIGHKSFCIPIPYNKKRNIGANWKKSGIVFGLLIKVGG